MTFTEQNQQDKRYMEYLLHPEDEIDMPCLQKMLRSGGEGVLPYVISQNGEEIRLRAETTDKISFAQFVSAVLSRQQILNAFFTLISALNGKEPDPEENVPFAISSEEIFWSAQEKKSYLLFFPVLRNGQREKTDLRRYLKELLFQIKFDQTEDWSYITQMAGFLEREEGFSLPALQDFLQKLLRQPRPKPAGPEEEKQKTEKAVCPVCGNRCRPDARFCTKCGAPITSSGETTVASPPELAVPYLLRCATGEKIYIDKQQFLIGRTEEKVDYSVPENQAISRVHAEIFIRDQQFFLVDKHSANHTYVDGQLVQQNVETQLSHGCQIRLANEEFEFYLY